MKKTRLYKSLNTITRYNNCGFIHVSEILKTEAKLHFL